MPVLCRGRAGWYTRRASERSHRTLSNLILVSPSGWPTGRLDPAARELPADEPGKSGWDTPGPVAAHRRLFELVHRGDILLVHSPVCPPSLCRVVPAVACLRLQLKSSRRAISPLLLLFAPLAAGPFELSGAPLVHAREAEATDASDGRATGRPAPTREREEKERKKPAPFDSPARPTNATEEATRNSNSIGLDQQSGGALTRSCWSDQKL